MPPEVTASSEAPSGLTNNESNNIDEIQMANHINEDDTKASKKHQLMLSGDNSKKAQDNIPDKADCRGINHTDDQSTSSCSFVAVPAASTRKRDRSHDFVEGHDNNSKSRRISNNATATSPIPSGRNISHSQDPQQEGRYNSTHLTSNSSSSVCNDQRDNSSTLPSTLNLQNSAPQVENQEEQEQQEEETVAVEILNNNTSNASPNSSSLNNINQPLIPLALPPNFQQRLMLQQVQFRFPDLQQEPMTLEEKIHYAIDLWSSQKRLLLLQCLHLSGLQE